MGNTTDKYVTFTTSSNTKYIIAGYRNDELTNIKLQLGSTATPYTPYTGDTHNLNLGENLFKPFSFVSRTSNGLTSMRNDDNSITMLGTTTAIVNHWLNDLNMKLPKGTYTFSTSCNLTSRMTFVLKDGGGNNVISFNSGNSYTFTLASDTTIAQALIQVSSGITLNEVFTLMLAKGSTAKPYTPYITPIELNIIPNTTYQDYPIKKNGNWYIHRQVKKVILDGSETGWSIQSRGSGVYRAYKSFSDLKAISSRNKVIANYFLFNGDSESVGNVYAYDTTIYFNTDKTSTSDWQTWLGTHNTTVLYTLATPIDEPITEPSLIYQLDNLQRAKSYYPETNVTTETENLEPIIEAKALEKIV